MSVVPWVAELVRAFWADAGAVEAFPRELRRPIARVLPVSIVLLPRLRLDDVREWLRDNGICCPCDQGDRPLRACLAACRGHGLVFLDGADPADEQCFSLGHEVGHFLRHYWRPRQLACRRLGGQVVEVFDGERSATSQERLHALLRNVPLGFQLHLMRRGPRRELLDAEVARAEEDADLLAYELLAPARDVLARLGTVRDEAARERLVEMLQSMFGLPREPAGCYAELLLPVVREDPLLRRLRS
jgi:hypothetical protein